jgi:hypothetical protein
MLTTLAVAAMMISTVLPASLAGAQMTGQSMADMVKNAKTAADHEALAAMYDKEAANAKEMAAAHEKMAQSYKSFTGKGTGASAMPQHCASLVKSFQGEAAMYERWRQPNATRPSDQNSPARAARLGLPE